MKDEENMVWSASKVLIVVAVVASVAVTVGQFPVDPIDDVLVAIIQRFLSALVSAPRARWVLRTCPLQNVQVPSLRRPIASHLIQMARQIL